MTEKEFKVNEYITLNLENAITNFYIKRSYIGQCINSMSLWIQISKKLCKIPSIEAIVDNLGIYSL